jgi:hypothetical protein
MNGRWIVGLCLTAVAAGAAFGHVRMPNDLATLRSPEIVTPTTDRPCSTEDAVGPCFWDAKTQGNGKGLSFWILENGTVAHVVDYATAYDMYLLAYGENNGCREDFDANYRGTRFVSDLPDDLQQKLAEGRMSLDSDGFQESPMMADYEDGSVIEVLGDGPITQVIVLGPYDGAC